ncbi:MAG: hypothetical protein K0Q94_2467 [Paenibacillus sp.]|nr:hypothetical protein [Paenibacillus sp.]
MKHWRHGATVSLCAILLLISCLFTGSAVHSSGSIPAFPGAEGFGMYATGARGGDVYIVTNLNDRGAGSFRDAVSQGNRTVVFNVYGTIELESLLQIAGDNMTIAGQTAPGDGVTIIGAPVHIVADNIIVRYMRFRLGDINNMEVDALYARGENIIIDHCSFSWGTDEVLSLYNNKNVTVQWSIVGEALANSIHSKGMHGFGGIWGTSSSYHHNLILHNMDRNPRFVGYTAPPYPDELLIDFRNNVIFDWGSHNSHHGEGTDFNMINNYYKWGNSTRTDRKSAIFCCGSNSNYFVNGNYMDGDPAVTANNELGMYSWGAGMTPAPGPIPRNPGLPVTTVTYQSATDAYELVLNGVGAIAPRRDSIDSRMVSEVRNREGRFIDSQREVGGYVQMAGGPILTDSDSDGMPDIWEIARGLNPNSATDRNGDDDSDGYTNLEEYINGIVSTGSASPVVALTSPALYSQHDTGGSITVTASAYDPDGSIAKVQFYANDVLLGEDAAYPYAFIWTGVPEGTYSMTARAIDDTGMATSTSAHNIFINNTGDAGAWSSTDIGLPGIPGHADLTGSVLTVKSNGSMNSQDVTHFVYQPLQGDGELIARVDSITKTNQKAKAGMMIRDSLNGGSRMAMIGLDLQGQTFMPTFYHRDIADTAYTYEEYGAEFALPYWIKLTRVQDVVSGYISLNGSSWTKVSEVSFGDDPAYIGFVSDASQEIIAHQYYNTSRFSNISFRDYTNFPYSPTGIQTSRSSVDVRLTWDIAANTDYYEVGRSFQSGGPYATIGTSAGISYTDSTAVPGFNYFYVVSSVNSYGTSVVPSAEVNGSLLGYPTITRLAYETFETADLGTTSPPGITPKRATDVNYMDVVSVPSGSTGNGSSQAVRFADMSSTITEGTSSFQAQSGQFSAQVDFMLEAKASPFRAFRIMDSVSSNKAYVELALYSKSGCSTGPCFTYRHTDGNYYPLPSNNGFTNNKWYTIKAIVDTQESEAEIFINGVSSGTIPFYIGSGWASPPASLSAIGGYSGSTSQYTMYWDNMEVIVSNLDGPANITGTPGNTTATIGWDALAEAESYNVYRFNTLTGRYVRIVSGLTGTTFTDTGLTNGTTYTYAVAAVDTGTGEGDYSASVAVTPQP